MSINSFSAKLGKMNLTKTNVRLCLHQRQSGNFNILRLKIGVFIILSVLTSLPAYFFSLLFPHHGMFLKDFINLMNSGLELQYSL